MTDEASIAEGSATAVPVSPLRVRRIAGWDIALAVVFLVFALLTGVLDAVGQVFLLAFTDYCPPATCHPDVGFDQVSIVWLVMAIVFVAGTVVCIIRLVRGRRAWWLALVVWVAQLVGAVIAVALYFAAVG